MDTPYSQHTTTRGFHYSYLHLKPTDQQNGNYILFLHGFPSSSYDWRYQIQHFSKKGYGIVAPDLLGYGKTSKPLEIEAYKAKPMIEDLVEILRHEAIEKVAGVGHDWGSFALSRLANYYPERLSKLVFLDVGYSAPGHGLSLQAIQYINQSVQAAMGYGVFGYFLFFKEDDAAKLMDKHSESVQSLIYSKDAELGKKYMGAEGGFREWLEAGKVADAESWFSSKDKEVYQKSFSEGYAAPINWYRAAIDNINEEDEKAIPKENCVLVHPTLLISSTNFISATADFASQMKPVVPDLKVESVDAGHWIQIEKPDVVNELLDTFLAA